MSSGSESGSEVEDTPSVAPVSESGARSPPTADTVAPPDGESDSAVESSSNSSDSEGSSSDEDGDESSSEDSSEEEPTLKYQRVGAK